MAERKGYLMHGGYHCADVEGGAGMNEWERRKWMKTDM